MVLAAKKTRVESERGASIHADLSEAGFYEKYDWCLNPRLTLDDQLHRLGEEVRHGAGLSPGWQRGECAINVYLLACGIACTVDDYLGRRVWDLALITERFPRLRLATATIRGLLGLPHAVRTSLGDRAVRRWRESWTRCVEMACEILVGSTAPDEERWKELWSAYEALRRTKLPPGLLRRRLRIPEGFRCQDLSHHDVLAMARRFADRRPDRRGALVVLGVRTAGAYFAPLAKACLATLGWPQVSWLTIRPREGLTGPERRRLRRLARDRAQWLVIDDHPSTGRTLMLVLAALERSGVDPAQITILTPRHPARPDWALPREAPGAGRVAVITLEPEETHKARLLTPRAVAPLLHDWFGKQGWRRVVVRTSPQVEAVNARFADHGRDGFQVRLQHLFEVQLGGDNGEPIVVHVVAKSVGWGWLGYHAYLAGTRLADFVAPVIGLRHGLLFSRWVGDPSGPSTGSSKTVPVATLAAYVARRTQRLRLSEDPGLEGHDDAWDGWKVLLGVLRRAYGPYFGRLKADLLRSQLRRFASPHPILVDGRMRPDEWLETPDGARKTDYEHHNFGPAEPSVVDPAYDLASAIFEFRLDDRAESDLLRAYAQATVDASVADRLLLYKLLSGTLAMQQAAIAAPLARSVRQGAQWNARYIDARTFLASQVHRACARLLPRRPEPTWSSPLFFLDLDGVFDCEVLGFPHTTPSGLTALALLQNDGLAVVLNSGRSLQHVQRYCRIYGLPGGVAEYGSVFLDAVGGREVALTTRSALEQLQDCREALRALPGVFVDEEYRYAVRAYRYQGGTTVGLADSEVQGLLSRSDFRELACITKSSDTYIVQRGITKGTAVAAVKHYLGRPETPVIAMGDSVEDVPMLETATTWYAPADCSLEVRKLALERGGRGEGTGHITVRSRQRGFLEAAQDLLRKQGLRPRDMPGLSRPARVRTAADLLVILLGVAERSQASRFLNAFAWRRL